MENNITKLAKDAFSKENLAKVESFAKDKLEELKTENSRKEIINNLQSVLYMGKTKFKKIWSSGIKGKIVICVGIIVIVVAVRGCFSEDDISAFKSDTLCFTEDDFPKVRSIDALYYDGEKDPDLGYVQVVPNLRKLPKRLIDETLCASLNPTIDDVKLHKKGCAYLNDADFSYHALVVHVEDDYVVVAPNSTSMYGDFHAVVYTDKEYFEKQKLRTGYYVLVGRKTLPLVNGSSETMYAYRELDEQSNELAINALKYNLEAHQAAEDENNKRSNMAYDDKQQKERENEERMIKEESEKFTKLSNAAYKKYINLAKNDNIKNRIHVVPQMDGIITFSAVPFWRIPGMERASMEDLKNAVAENGWGSIATECMSFNDSRSRCDRIDEFTKQFFTDKSYTLTIESKDQKKKYRAFVIKGTQHIRLFEPGWADYGVLLPGEDLYIAGGDEDLDIKQFACDEVSLGGALNGEKSKFQAAFEERYGKNR